MEHNNALKDPAEGANQQVKKKRNVFRAKKNNGEIMNNDPDTQFCISEKLSNGPVKDSKPENGSDSTFSSSCDVIKHSNNESSNKDCGKSDINDIKEPTSVTENDDTENAKKVAAFVRKVLNNGVPDTDMAWPLCLLIESKRSVEISKQDFLNIIMEKTAEVKATKLHNAKQMVNISVCKEQQRSYYKKYQKLLNHVNAMNSELELLKRGPDPIDINVRNVGINVDMPKKKKNGN